MGTIQESLRKMAALPESFHVSVDCPESRYVTADRPEPHQDISESAHVKPEALAKMAATPHHG